MGEEQEPPELKASVLGGTKAFGASGADNSTSSRAEEGTRANACVGKREGT